MKNKLILWCVFLFSFNFAQAQVRTNFRLDMRTLRCDKTTESGEDEVYLIINGKRSSGEFWNYRLPGPNNHFDLNDGNGQREVSNFILAQSSYDIQPGDVVVLNIAIMEEDGGTLGQMIINQGQEMLSACATSNPYCAAGLLGTVIAQYLHVGQDTDDYIGSFTMTLSRDQMGAIHTDFTNLVRCSIANNGISYPQGALISFSGDGSSYLGLFQFEFGGPW